MQGWGARAGRAARACGVSAAVPRAGETPQQAIRRSRGAERVKGRRPVRLQGYTSDRGAGEASGGGRPPIDRVRREELTADAHEEVASAPEAPVPARACTGKARTRAPAPGGRQAQRRRAPAAQELPLASAAEQGALVRIGARAAGSEGSGRSRAPE